MLPGKKIMHDDIAEEYYEDKVWFVKSMLTLECWTQHYHLHCGNLFPRPQELYFSERHSQIGVWRQSALLVLGSCTCSSIWEMSRRGSFKPGKEVPEEHKVVKKESNTIFLYQSQTISQLSYLQWSVQLHVHLFKVASGRGLGHVQGRYRCLISWRSILKCGSWQTGIHSFEAE